MSDMLLQALKKKLEGDVAVAKANVLIYKQHHLEFAPLRRDVLSWILS